MKSTRSRAVQMAHKVTGEVTVDLLRKTHTRRGSWWSSRRWYSSAPETVTTISTTLTTTPLPLLSLSCSFQTGLPHNNSLIWLRSKFAFLLTQAFQIFTNVQLKEIKYVYTACSYVCVLYIGYCTSEKINALFHDVVYISLYILVS